jgi:hypothetical protein
MGEIEKLGLVAGFHMLQQLWISSLNVVYKSKRPFGEHGCWLLLLLWSLVYEQEGLQQHLHGPRLVQRAEMTCSHDS